MDKKQFNKITKEIYLQYGFIQKNGKFILQLQDVNIVVLFSSYRNVKYFNYYFSINELHDSNVPIEKRYDTLVEIKMEHNQSAQGYHKHEILFEQYSEEEYKTLLSNMIHLYFDAYKENAIQYLKNNAYNMCLSQKAKEYLELT